MENPNVHFLVLLGERSFITPYIFEECKYYDNVQIQHGNFLIRSVFFSRFHDLVYSRLPRILKKAFNFVLWRSEAFHFIENYRFDDSKQYYVIISDYGTNRVNFRKLERRKKKNIKFILLFLNPMSRTETERAVKSIPFFDIIVTFDPEDAKKNGFLYYPQIYSKRNSFIVRVTNEIKTAYFIGYDKGRGELLSGIAERLQEIGVRCVFKVKQGTANKCYPNLTYLSGILPYDKVLEDIAATDCLVEIIQPGQSGATLRYAEAVCYNKILITTNKMITELPCYNAKYMHIIEKPEDIEPSWFQLNEPIEYNYNGEFSPKKLLAFVEEQLTT